MGDMIELVLEIWKCPNCKSKHSIQSWDKSTLERCKNRFARRHFVSLGKQSSRNVGTRRWYVCPTCKETTYGEKIEVEVDINE